MNWLLCWAVSGGLLFDRASPWRNPQSDRRLIATITAISFIWLGWGSLEAQLRNIPAEGSRVAGFTIILIALFTALVIQSLRSKGTRMVDPVDPNLPVPVPEPAVQPTQVAHPWRASLRSGVQAVVGALVTFAALWPLLEPILGETISHFIDPAQVAGVTLSVGVIATAITRIMAIPAVNKALTKIKLGASPNVPPVA